MTRYVHHPRVYLSASMARRNEIRACAQHLRDAGCLVVSTWHDTDEAINDHALTDAECWTIADRDECEIWMADNLIFFGDAPGTYAGQGGKFCELGLARASGLLITVIGPREGVFPRSKGIAHYATWDAYLERLESLS